MDGGPNQNERTSQHEQSLASLFREIPPLPSLTMDDSSEQRDQAHEPSSNPLPPITSSSKRKSKTASLAFWPRVSKPSFHRKSSSVPTASSIASKDRKDRKGSRDSISRTPMPGPPFVHPSTSERNSRPPVFREDLNSPSSPQRDRSPPAQSSTTREYSTKPLPAIPSVTGSPVQERHSQFADSLHSATSGRATPTRKGITLFEALALGFDDSGNGTVDHVRDESAPNGTGTSDASIGHEDSYTNARDHGYSKAQMSGQTPQNIDTAPAPTLQRRLSSLVAKINPSSERKKSIRRSKWRTISGPPVASAHAEAHPRRSQTTARPHSTDEAPYLRTQKPLTPPTTPSANNSANNRPSRKQLLDQRWGRTAGMMRLGGSAAVRQALVNSDVVAMERWEWPMPQDPSQNRARRLAGPSEHTEKSSGLIAKGVQEGEGREEKNGGEKKKRRRGTSRSGGFGMLGVEADLWRSRRRGTWRGEIDMDLDLDWQGNGRGKGKAGDKISGEGEEKMERTETKREVEVVRRLGRWGLEARSSSTRSIGVANRDGAINRTSGQQEVRPEKVVITTPKVIQNSPNDSKHGGEGNASSNAAPDDKAGGGEETGQSSPADSGYSRGSESKNFRQSSSSHSEIPKREAEAESHVIHQRLRDSIVPLGESSLTATAEGEEGGGEEESLQRVASEEDEKALTEKRENRDKDVEDELFAEQLQLQYLKEQHLSWWEKSPPKPGAFNPVRQRKAVRESGRWRSRIPVPVAQPAMGSDELTLSTPEPRVTHRKAARKDVIDYTEVSEDWVEDCVTLLTNISVSPSINRQRKGLVLPANGGSSRSANTCATRIISPASGATAPEVAELEDDADAPSSPEAICVEGKPAVPKRSPRRVKPNFQFPDHTQLRSSYSPEAGVERYALTPIIYGHYVAVQRELNKRFDAGDFSGWAGLGDGADRQSLAPGPLNPKHSRQRREADTKRNVKHMIENLRYSSSDDE
jgi:hypothetical protein